MIASARHKVIMKAEFVRRKNILLRCDVNALAKIKNIKIINIFNSLELSASVQSIEAARFPDTEKDSPHRDDL